MPITKTIGTNKDSEIVISGKYVSEHHVLLIEDGETNYIEDLESTYGTHINGKRTIKRTLLKPNDCVKIGMQLFHWKDYVGDQSNLEQNPFFLIDLVKPTGIINWSDYKFILLLSLGAIILIPIAVPVFLMYAVSAINRRNIVTSELIELTQHTNLLVWSTSILAGYVFLNLTQKAVREKMKKS